MVTTFGNALNKMLGYAYLKGLVPSFVIDNPKKTRMAALGLVALIGTTVLKDNVHFGSVEIHNPTRNHYTWGLFPKTTVKGSEAKGDIYTIGLYSINKFVEVKHEGNSSAFGIVGGENIYERNTIHIGNSTSAGIVGGENTHKQNSVQTGDSRALGIIAAVTFYKENSSHNGNQSTIAILRRDPKFGIGPRNIIREGN